MSVWKSYRHILVCFCVAYLSTPADAEIAIGVSAPLTGPLAVFGNQISGGASSAIDEINAQGGIRGQKIRLVLVDDGAEPARAAMEAQRLIFQDKVAALVGYPFSSEAFAASRIASDEKTLMITLATAPDLTVQNRGDVLRSIGPSDSLATFIADYISSNFGNKQLGVQFAEEATGFNMALRNSLKAKNIELKQSEVVPYQNLQPPKWAPNVQTLVIPLVISTPPWVRELAKQNPSVNIIVPKIVISDEPSKEIQGLENLRIISNPWPDFFPTAKEIITRAKRKGLDTNGYFLYAYTAVQIAAASVSLANMQTSGPSLFAAAQTSEGIQTAIGRLKFDKTGELVGWRYAVLSASAAGPDVCKLPECKKYEACPPDCPK